MANQLQTTQQKRLASQASKEKFSVFLTKDNVKQLINQSVGKNAQSFTTAILSAVSSNPELEKCSFRSIIAAGLLGESLKLSPSPQLGQYYLVPFNKKEHGEVVDTSAVFVLGAKGYKQLAMRTGQYLDIDVIEIKEGEYKGRDKFTGKQRFEFIEDDDAREELPTIGYMAYFELINGFRKVIYWSKSKMIKHADTYSPAFSAAKYAEYIKGTIPQKELYKYSSYWYKNFTEMAFKTLIRHLISQWGIMSIEMINAFTADDKIINEDGTSSYVEIGQDAPSDYALSPAPEKDEKPTDEEKGEFDFFGTDEETKAE